MSYTNIKKNTVTSFSDVLVNIKYYHRILVYHAMLKMYHKTPKTLPLSKLGKECNYLENTVYAQIAIFWKNNYYFDVRILNHKLPMTLIMVSLLTQSNKISLF